jgi:hypothetical protein
VQDAVPPTGEAASLRRWETIMRRFLLSSILAIGPMLTKVRRAH